MRPYLAILRDSFREAFASRTLPFLLVFFTIALAVLAPIGLREDVPWRLTFEEISDQTLWLAKLRQQVTQEGENPGKRLLERLPDNVERRLGLHDQPAAPEATGPSGALMLSMAINDEVLPDRDFYSEAAWDKVPLSDEARALIKRDPATLPERDLKRLNRLLLSAAYPGALKAPPASRATVTYLGFEIPGLSGGLEQFFSETEMVRQIIRSLIYAICVWIIGPVGLLVGVIVTADLMPRTFEPGAIDLLLSKPVNRTLVFLTKFLGACAFILISFSYLVAGLWLIFWLRLDVWAPQILGAIPLFLFSFAVIYAVSAVTGLRWRSPIVSVMITVLVWGASFAVGFTRDTLETVIRSGQRVGQITPAGDVLIVSDFERSAYVWSEQEDDWVQQAGLIPSGSASAGHPLLQPKVLGPIYDPAGDRIIVAETGAVGENALRFGSAKSNWRTSIGATLPPGTVDLFATSDGRLLAAGRAGLFEFRGDPTVAKKEFMIFGVLDLVPDDVENVFVRVDNSDGAWTETVAVDLDQAGDTAVFYDRGVVTLLRRNDAGRFEPTAERALFAEDKDPPPAIVAIAKNRIAVAVKDGTIHLLADDTLATTATLQPYGEEVPRVVTTSPDGVHLAVLFHSGDLWLGRMPNDGKRAGGLGVPPGQGDLSAVAFDHEGHLLVADRLRRVTRCSLPALEVVERYSGSLPGSEKFYRYALIPISYVLPDTYGLRSVYQYLFTDLKSESTTGDETDLESRRIHLELRRPLVQNLIFLAVVLGLASLYVTRKDF